MNLLNIIKLSKILEKLQTIDSGQGPIIVETIEEGAEVFIEDSEGQTVPAPDGEYVIDEGKRKLIVESGKITKIEDVPEEPADNTNPADNQEPNNDNMEGEGGNQEPADNQEPANNEPSIDDLNARIAELEDLLAQRDAEIASLNEEIANLKSAPVETEMHTVTPKSPFKSYKH